MIKSFLIICASLWYSAASAQVTVVNPSFEDSPSDATIPKGWLACQPGTTPDILPGFWGEYGEAYHGRTYVGLITRQNATFESLGQRLSAELPAGECHRFSLAMAHGQVYSGYNKPIRLRVWLGAEKCDKDQLIYESDWIDHEDWRVYKIEFTPNENYRYIQFEAFYKEGPFSHMGNILLDKLSAIYPCGKV